MTVPEVHNQSDPNGLIDETSPYLLQHAYNPVRWYPWGQEAFDLARDQDKPIFLSIGYSTCYWCHVMERETFEDPEIGSMLEENYIAIKVDREEHPEVDEIYMTATQILNQGRGGWPMSVFLEPDTLKPFYAGTYFPRTDQVGRPGFDKVLTNLYSAWTNQRAQVLDQADRVAKSVQFQLEAKSQAPMSLHEDVLGNAVNQIIDRYDTAEGGFGQAPKFPMPVWLEILEARASDLEEVQVALDATLHAMARGGLHDQLGGGFHRYSTDGTWTVPHFEKMLYDQGQLASVYAAAYERTGSEKFADVLKSLLEYVSREMTDSTGAFYSAQDAEVNAREGLNYLWQPEEVRTALRKAKKESYVELAFAAWGLDGASNFQDPHHQDEPPQWVLRGDLSLNELAVQFSISKEEVEKRLSECRKVLMKVRDAREQPGLDDKVIAAWNGLMIGGMADGGRVLQMENFTQAAERAAEDVLRRLRTDSGYLLRTARGEKAHIDAFLIDYASMIRGLVRLNKATGNSKWLAESFRLAEKAVELFGLSDGGFADVAKGRSDLFVRARSTSDGAMPSGATLMADSLIELWELFEGQENVPAELEKWAVGAVRSLTPDLARAPSSAALGSKAFDRLRQKRPDLIGQEKESQPVFVTLKEVSWKNDSEVFVRVELKIKDGWHINSSKPKINSLISTSVTTSKGIEVNVDWPEPIEKDGPIGTLSLYEGTVELPITITNPDSLEFDQSAQLTLQLQPCTDSWCQRPIRFVLPLKEKED